MDLDLGFRRYAFDAFEIYNVLSYEADVANWVHASLVSLICVRASMLRY